MTLKRRQFIREFKLQVLQEADSGKSISQLACEHQGSIQRRCTAGGNSFVVRVTAPFQVIARRSVTRLGSRPLSVESVN